MNGLDLETIMLQIFVLFLLAKVAGILCEKVKISSVIGEIFAGIIVGNTILFHWLSLDADVGLGTEMGLFSILAELGVIFLLFSVGLETPFSELRKVGKTATLVAVLGVVLPLLGGFALFMALDGQVAEALFVGAAMVATSVGITARVIKDMSLTHTIESRVIIGAAVIDDVLGMIILAIVVGVAGGEGGVVDIILVSAEGIMFVLGVIFLGSIVLPRIRRKLAARREADEPLKCGERKRAVITPLPLAIIVCLGLSLFASYVNLAAIIGAFLAGMVFAEFKDKWPCEEDFHPINGFLVPFFFVFVGLQVNLASFSEVLLLAVVVTALAAVTKLAGCALGARSLGGRSATIIGVGMIPRGEVGIIVASIGYGMEAISEELYAVVVFMSMATTILAPPLLTWSFRRKLREDGSCGVPGSGEAA